MVLALDIGGTKISVALISRNGKIKKYHKEATAKNLKGFTTQILKMVRETKGNLPLRALGVSMAGWIDARSKTVIKAPNISFLDGFPLGKFLQTKTGLKVYLENDANAAALAESKFGAGRNFKNIIYLTISTGIGAGIIINGKLYRGQGLAGEAGHINILPGGPKCSCGNYGCLEAISSGNAISQAILKAPRNSKIKLLKKSEQKIDLIFKFAKQGDEYSQKIVFRFLWGIGLALSDLIYILHPEIIVLGGGVILAHKSLLPNLRKYVNLRLKQGFKKTVKIVPAGLGQNSSLIGAAISAGEL